MKKLLLWICVLPFVGHAQQQEDTVLHNFNAEKYRLNKKGMVVLTNWAGMNIATGAVGYAVSKDKAYRSFHAMNTAWGIVNLSIALPGLFAREPEQQTLFQTTSNQTRTEKLYLANALLDVVYISGGVVLLSYANNQESQDRYKKFSGYGNSVLMQGAALLVFDATMLTLHNRHRHRALDRHLHQMHFSFSYKAVRMRWQF